MNYESEKSFAVRLKQHGKTLKLENMESKTTVFMNRGPSMKFYISYY